MAKDLLYTPNLGYKKDYYTEGYIQENKEEQESVINSKEEDSKESLVDQLLNDVDTMLKFLPDQIINIYFSPYIGMKYEYENLRKEYSEESKNNDDNNKKDDSSNNPTDNKDNNNNDFGDVPDDMFDRIDDVYIDVEDPKSDPAKIIQDSYYVNFLDIYKDYLSKMKVAISNYIFTTIQSVGKGLKDQSELIDYSTKTIKNEQLKHLSDYITKSNISIDQTMRLHRKLYDIDETILHIKKIRLSKTEAVRYNEIEELQQNDFLDVDSNILLKESRRVAEKKYEENFYALYKYLNSSVILLDESLKTVTRQDKAKIVINKYEERE